MRSVNSKDLLALGMILVAALAVAYASAETPQRKAPVKTVSHVDLARYAGSWYEIARYPNRFEKSTEHSVMATYTLRPDGKVTVVNRCLRADGHERSVRGWAKVADLKTNAKLRVTFFWPFYGDYWIIDLGNDYDYAVVGEPGRKYLWILARQPQIGEAAYQQILTRLTEQGYDTDRLVKTPQGG